jgi:hypothetical protein
MAPIVRPKVEVKAADPTQVFNQRHERLRGPTVNGGNSGYALPKAGASTPAYDSRFQTPLNRQPVAREFPSRKF